MQWKKREKERKMERHEGGERRYEEKKGMRVVEREKESIEKRRENMRESKR